MRVPRLCRVVTVPMTFATLLHEQIRRIVEAGVDVTLVSSPGEEVSRLRDALAVRWHEIPMTRQVSPTRDLAALAALTRFLRRERFDLVHSSTPKAGLLTALAGTLARIPLRLHTYTGQPWVELHGPMRWLSREADRLIGRLDTHLYADSHSQRAFLVTNGIVAADRLRVLGAGSISGVDLRRFDPVALAGERSAIREQLRIAPESQVLVFVGRLARDKGIRELIAAFQILSRQFDLVDLLLVGPQEPERDPLPSEVVAEIATNPRIHAVGFSHHPERYLAASDIFCLPSYREGFGSVVIEAGALGLPSVATQVYGLLDAVVEGETGLLVPAKDVGALVEALKTLLQETALRQRMGEAARRRSVQLFDANMVNAGVVAEYKRLLLR
jgi:glycosyltransferase involved in cell wall biosynthesis